MFLSKKLKRPRMTREEADAIIERAKTEAPLELEKGDIPAMMLAAVIVFLPFILVLGGSMVFLWWFIFHVWAG
jgi:dihydroxyacid dehydratase/phosphogluconate dehydratase